MRELVHEGDRGPARQQGVHVHLRERAVAVGDLPSRSHLEAVQHHLRTRPVVVLEEADDAVGAALDPAVCLGQHGVRLADARCRAEVDPELSASHLVPTSRSARCAVSVRLAVRVRSGSPSPVR